MAKVLLNHPHNWSFQVHENSSGSRFNKVPCLGYSVPCSRTLFVHSQFNNFHGRTMHYRAVFSRALNDDGDQGDVDEDGTSDEQSSQSDTNEVKNESFREGLERIVGNDDSTFTGVDLATLIRNKYGRSYDVTLIKKEFMGRNLLAMNVMWKYVEQRSFPLTEEEYLLRLDDVANNLRCWGAVSHIRNSLAKMKDRPRIGKAVSIFIDMDESGGRANEWIYK